MLMRCTRGFRLKANNQISQIIYLFIGLFNRDNAV